MSGPYKLPCEKPCPYCVEVTPLYDMGDIETWLSGDCEECCKTFSYDCNLEEYYNEKGEVINA